MTTHRSALKRFAWLSIAAAIATITLKTAAYLFTGSVGLLSDALESVVNLVGAFMALGMLTIAARPEDDDHAFGHGKAEYFSSGVEGTLILLAAISISVAAIHRLFWPRELQQLGVGLSVSVAASVINLVVAIVLRRASRRHDSITLEANAQHLFTDVWTSAGVLVGVGLVATTGRQLLDPVTALLVAGNIFTTGLGIVRKSVLGLMDTALPEHEIQTLEKTFASYQEQGILFHALKTRRAGSRRFISVHVLVPGAWTVHDGHQWLERIEADIRRALPGIHVITHLESLDDPAAWDDISLDRDEPEGRSTHAVEAGGPSRRS